VSQVQIDHGGLDLLVPQQLLDGVEMSAGFQEMGGEAVTQRMDRGGRKIELVADHGDEALEGTDRHGAGG